MFGFSQYNDFYFIFSIRPNNVCESCPDMSGSMHGLDFELNGTPSSTLLLDHGFPLLVFSHQPNNVTVHKSRYSGYAHGLLV